MMTIAFGSSAPPVESSTMDATWFAIVCTHALRVERASQRGAWKTAAFCSSQNVHTGASVQLCGGQRLPSTQAAAMKPLWRASERTYAMTLVRAICPSKLK